MHHMFLGLSGTHRRRRNQSSHRTSDIMGSLNRSPTNHQAQHRPSTVSKNELAHERSLTNHLDTSSIPRQGFDPLGHTEVPLWVGDQRVTVDADITYSYYPFLAVTNLQNVMPQDVNYLESQGCFRIPTRAILDEFVQQYFLHVHPLLPFINEGDFWDLYCHQGSEGTGEKMSLLVFQAMLFSCCNVSQQFRIYISDMSLIRISLFLKVASKR